MNKGKEMMKRKSNYKTHSFFREITSILLTFFTIY